MPTNPLKAKVSPANFVSAYRASEYAQWARDKGLKEDAKAWEEAVRNGWDDLHFSQTRRDELERKHGRPTASLWQLHQR